MAESKTVTKPAAPRKKASPKPQYATVDDLKGIMDTMSSMADAFKKIADKVYAEPQKMQSPEQVKYSAEVAKAAPDVSVVNPAWIEKANEILGDVIDHCEVFYPKHGGTIFTVIIKESSSNASADYLSRHKADRRSKEIGNEGIEGVESWCKLIKENLKRGK